MLCAKSGAEILKNLSFFGAEITKIRVAWRQNETFFTKHLSKIFKFFLLIYSNDGTIA